MQKLNLYKYTSKVSYLKDSYCKQLLHLSPLAELNDPFEGHAIIKPLTPTVALEQPELIDNFHNIFKEQNPSITRKEVIEHIQNDDFKKGLIEYESIKRALFPEHGITCFSSDPANLPMWAYYANNHEGYCVEFEMDIDYIQKKNQISPKEGIKLANDIKHSHFCLSFFSNEIEFVFSKVRYTNALPVIKHDELFAMKSDYDKLDYLVKNSIGAKYNQWRHEDEYRLIANQNSKYGGGLMSLTYYAPFLKFTGVIIGAKMEGKYINKIQELQKKYEFSVKKASLSDNAYKLEIV